MTTNNDTTERLRCDECSPAQVRQPDGSVTLSHRPDCPAMWAPVPACPASPSGYDCIGDDICPRCGEAVN